jgi:peptide/nickel transport system permease protein
MVVRIRAAKMAQPQTRKWIPRLWRPRLLENRKAAAGLAIIGLFVLLVLLAPVLTPGAPVESVAPPGAQPPSADHILGTTEVGQDVLRQLLWGARTSMFVAFVVGVFTTAVAIAVGVAGGFLGGRADNVLTMLTNVFLLIPGLPLIIVLAVFLPPGSVTIVVILTITGWSWPARELRSQALSLRERDFVAAAIVSGERKWRVMLAEVVPNMWSLIIASFITSTTYVLGAQASLEFLGLGDMSKVTLGTMLFWAQNYSALISGAWWTFVPPGLLIALLAFSLALVNYGMDEITNPRLRMASYMRRLFGSRELLLAMRRTPVNHEPH